MYRALSIILGAAIIVCLGLAVTAPVRAVDPVCDITGPTGGSINELLVFDASGSYDPDGVITSYVWTYTGGVREDWTQRYDGTVDPVTEGWVCEDVCGTDVWSIEIDPTDTGAYCGGGSLNCAWHIEDGTLTKNKYRWDNNPAAPNGATYLARLRHVSCPGGNNAKIVRIGTGNIGTELDPFGKRVELSAQNDDVDPTIMHINNNRPDPDPGDVGTFSRNEWHIFRTTLTGAGWALYIDENPTPFATGVGNTSTDTSLQFGCINTSSGDAELDVDYVYFYLGGALGPGVNLHDPSKLFVRYPAGGDYTVCVTVIDNEGGSAICCEGPFTIGNRPPTCAITYTPALPTAGQTLTFNANATDPDGHTPASWAWTFGDGGTGTGDPATHVYAADGTYTVGCTVTDPEGATGTCSISVTLENLAPTCSITYTPANPVSGQTVTFEANATDENGDETITSWAWAFGDGGTRSGDPATHSYASAGEYTVTCTVTDAGGASGVCSTSVSVNTPPTCAIEVTSGSPYRTCYPICFSGAGSSDPDGTVVSYLWSFGDGAPAAVPVPNGTFSDESAWTRYGTAEGEGGISTTFTYCTFNANPGGNFFGRASDGLAIQDHIYQTLSGLVPYGLYRAQATIGTHQYTDPNLLTVRIGVDPNGGTDPAAGSVVWAEGRNEGCPPSPATMGLNFQAGCGTSVTLFLEFEGPPGNGFNIAAVDDAAIVGATTTTGVEVCHAYQAAGTYTVTLTVTDDLGATTSCTTQVVVAAGVCCSIEVSPTDTHICETISFSATATGGTPPYTYAWDFGDGGTDSGQAVTHIYNASGTYVVQCVATDDAGTSGLCCATVQVAGALPICVIEGPDVVAPGTVACWNGYQSYDPDDCGGCGASCPGVGIVSYAWDFGGAGANLVTNADFEGAYPGGVADGWTAQEVAGSGIFWGDWAMYPYGPANEPNAHSGDHCQFAQFSDGGGIAADLRLYQVVSGLTIGEVYTVGGWIAMDDPGVSDSEVQIGYDLNGGTNFTWLPALPSNGYWQQGTASVVATGSTISIAYRWHSTAAPDAGYYYCYADDATVAALASDPTGCHTYTVEGPATVSLTVTDDEGDTSTCTKEITVSTEPLPTCSITYSPSSPSVLNMITFNGNAQDSQGGANIVSWVWTFGDGWGASGDPVTHMYADNGTYTVTLSVTDNLGKVGYCSAKVTVVNVLPVCQIVGPSSGLPGVEVCFDGASSSDPDGAIVSYVWDFGGMGVPPDLTVANPSFEDSSAWTVYDTPGPPNTFGFCSWTARTGSTWFGGASNWGSIGAGVRQTLSGALPGATYQAQVYIETNGAPTPANIHCRIGVDPAGGTDPAAATFADGYNQNCDPPQVWVPVMLEFMATSATPTVFVEYSAAAQEWTVAAMDDVSVVGVSKTAGFGPQACHTYADEGTYTVTLTVTDDDGDSSSCTHPIDIYVTPPTVEVTIPLSQGWHMISLPLEPVNKTILVDRTTKVEDPESIFYSAYAQGNDPRNRLFRMEPAVGYWVYNPDLYPTEAWYEIGVEPPVGKPHPGPWWQGFWFYVEPVEGISMTYTANPLPAGPMVRFMDINKNYAPGTFTWAWMMMGACARVPDPHNADVTTWPLTSALTDMKWGTSTPPTEPAVWLPSSECAGADAWDSGYVGLPLVGYTPGVGYYTVSPPSGQPYCGAPADTQFLTPGEGYWLDIEEPNVWLRLLAGQYP